MMNLVGFKAQAVCAECGGSCCKYAPGIVYPADLLEVTVESIILLLESGNYAVDFWGGPSGQDVLFLRPRSKGGDLVVPFSEWGGECIFLAEDGCILSFRERPQGCRMLEPNIDLGGDCDSHGHTKKHGKNAWVPFQAEIMGALEHFGCEPAEPPRAVEVLGAMLENIL